MTADVSILDYRPELAPDFERLNREWLEALFRVEDIDAQVFADPARHIIEPGGRQLYLESHSSLAPALRLYESMGFRYATPPARCEHECADLYMIYRG